MALSRAACTPGQPPPTCDPPAETVTLDVTVRLSAAAPACRSGRLQLEGEVATVEEELTFSGGVATLTLAGLPADRWRVELRCAVDVVAGHHEEVATAKTTVALTASARALVIDETSASVADGRGGVAVEPVRWSHQHEYSLFSRDRLQAIVRLPVDALDPAFEVATFDERWGYLYVDRTFFDTGPDGTQGFVLGSSAFERYDDTAHVVDVSHFAPLVTAMRALPWTRAQSLVVIIADDGEELLLLHGW